MKIATAAGIIAVAVVAVLIERVVFPPQAEAMGTPAEAGGVLPSSSRLTGKIVSIEDVSSSRAERRLRRAKVKLDSGETVQAWVPDACVVFPGYVTHLVETMDGAGARYTVAGGPE